VFIPKWLPVYGDRSFKGKCPREAEDQMSFFSWLECELPEFARLTFHPKVEGRRTPAQATIDRKMGAMKKGVVDVIAIGSPMLVMEIKRKDEKLSEWRDGQLKFLEESKNAGAVVAVVFGLEAAKEAYADWVSMQGKKP
jgi:hypothetical protein